jgi:hypothetical protein
VLIFGMLVFLAAGFTTVRVEASAKTNARYDCSSMVELVQANFTLRLWRRKIAPALNAFLRAMISLSMIPTRGNLARPSTNFGVRFS